jgi:hypothetical protein
MSNSHHVVFGGRRVVLRDGQVVRAKQPTSEERGLIDAFVKSHEVGYESGGFVEVVMKALESAGVEAELVLDKTGRRYVKFKSGKTKPLVEAARQASEIREKAGLPGFRSV